MNLSIIIITYNCQNYIAKFLDELLNSLKGFQDYEILINDNDSRDETWNICNSCLVNNNRVLLSRSENIGFAKANNVLIKKAKFQNILLLNPDVFDFSPQVWETLLKEWDRKNPCFIRLLNQDGSLQINVGEELSPLRVLKSMLGIKNNLSTISEKVNVDSGIMAFVLLSKRSIDEVGLISEDYHMYGEDHDWFIRARKKGYQPVYLPSIVLTHIGGASAKTRWKKKEESQVKLAAEKLVITKNFKGFPKYFLLFVHIMKRILS